MTEVTWGYLRVVLFMFYLSLFDLQDDLQVCDVWDRFYPEGLAVCAFWYSPGQSEGARVQVSRLPQTLRSERLHDGAHEG